MGNVPCSTCKTCNNEQEQRMELKNDVVNIIIMNKKDDRVAYAPQKETKTGFTKKPNLKIATSLTPSEKENQVINRKKN